jgi:hypothetical protein
MHIISRNVKSAAFAVVAASLVLAAGCQRSEEVHDDRTLEKRSHVETVKPEDRKDAFRP